MLEIRSELDRVRGVKSLGQSRSAHGIFSDRKRYGSRQKAMATELISRGTMYRMEVVSKTGTRLA